MKMQTAQHHTTAATPSPSEDTTMHASSTPALRPCLAFRDGSLAAELLVGPPIPPATRLPVATPGKAPIETVEAPTDEPGTLTGSDEAAVVSPPDTAPAPGDVATTPTLSRLS